MTKNTFVQIRDRIIISVQTTKPPTDEEWYSSMNFLSNCLTKKPENLCTLILTDGGAPSAVQRQRIKEIYGGKSIPTAILSSALIPRLVTASIALFNKSIRSYAPNEILEAYAHLQFTAKEKEQVFGALTDLQREIAPEKHQALEIGLHSLKSPSLQ
jgi:hypothetical protein